jgi:hypothetical protein
MKQNTLIFIVTIFCLLILLIGCHSEDEQHGNYMPSYCSASKTIAKSNKDCSCRIAFKDYMYEYTYIIINSNYYQIGPPCSQNVFKIKYINSIHDHNEPDYEFGFYLPIMKEEDFFKPDTFNIDTVDIFYQHPMGGHGGPIFNVDITLIWESVSINQGMYTGRGKFIINKEIPTSYPGYKWPVQEIPFVFCNKSPQ